MSIRGEIGGRKQTVTFEDIEMSKVFVEMRHTPRCGHVVVGAKMPSANLD
jgi:hypothetical protein